MSEWAKLADPCGVFWCHETGFSLSDDKPKELPGQLSAKISEWLNAGGLILCDPPEEEKDADGNEAAASDSAEDETPTERTDPGELSLSELRARCKELKISYTPKHGAAALAQKIMRTQKG